jgi:hypothetical protein
MECRTVSSSRSWRLARGGIAAAFAFAVAVTGAPAGAFAANGNTPINYPTFSGTAKLLNRNGTADIITSAGHTKQRILRLTTGGFRQTGSAWATEKLDLNQSFTTSFKAYLHHGMPGKDYADGFAFVVQSESTRALGGWGGGLGFRGIKHSVAVAFDTYKQPPDTAANTVSIVTGGNPDLHEAIAPAPIPLEARPFVARVSYDAATKDLKVYLKPLRAGYPEKLVLEHTVDLAAEVGASSAYVGFTGSTGSVLSKQDIYSWSVSTPSA